ncbi:MAG TPA: membrane dipeptidase [Burkholderiales bacterium]
MNRRRFFTSAAAVGAAVALRAFSADGQTKRLSYADMHSHIGIIGGRANVREAMTNNGMLIVARKIVADGPVIRRFPGKGVQQVREPAPGELASRFDAAFERLREEHKSQELIEVVDGEVLRRVLSGSLPAVVLAAEGADFLDGDVRRLEIARVHGLVHLQLVHYRISEVGDISTERPLHNGLTAFGREIVAACNRLGILLDVAHATSNGIAQALEISTRPMIYSHGHMTSSAPYWTYGATRARAIHAPLAKRIAEQGGVIGIWPLGSQYGSLDAYARALLDTAASLGVAHVGIGSDMFGLGGSSVIPGYEQFPQLEELLVKRGLNADDVRNIMGGNYVRVLGQALAV